MALRPQPPQSRTDQLAERNAAQQDVFLREVDEAVRHDEFLGFVQRYGKPLAAAVIAGLLALAGWLYWQHSSNQDRAAEAEKLTLAIDKLEAGNLDAARSTLDPLVKEGSHGSAVSAKLLEAGIALQQNRQADAVRLFAEVADDKAAPRPLRDLATVRQVSASFDAMQPQAVVAKLKPLAVPGNPWFGSAGELVAMAYVRQGRNDLAGPLFAAISRDKDVPESLRRRARQMAGVLGVDAIDDVAKAAAGDTPTQGNGAQANAAP